MVDFEKELEKEEVIDNSHNITDPRIPAKVNNFDDSQEIQPVPVTQPIDNKPKKNYLKTLVLLFGAIIVILIIISFSINLGIFTNKKVSEKQLIVGASFQMEENKSVKMEVGEQEHEIEVQNVGEDWAEIVIRSNPLKFRLEVNQVIELDLDDDGQSDIRVKLFRIDKNGKAVIAVKKITKESCEEDWICGEWGGCINGKRERVCTDNNDCGSEFFKPFSEQRCVGENPVDENITLPRVKGMNDLIRISNIPINFSDNSNVMNNTNSDNLNSDNFRSNHKMRFDYNLCVEEVDFNYRHNDFNSQGQVNIRVVDNNWTNSNTLIIKKYVVHFCSSEIINGSHEIIGDTVILKYKVKEPSTNVVSTCKCKHELIYNFYDIQRKDYEFRLIQEYLYDDNDSFDNGSLNNSQQEACGDGYCTYYETISTHSSYCPEDCEKCGNNFCDYGENISTSYHYCPEDCMNGVLNDSDTDNSACSSGQYFCNKTKGYYCKGFDYDLNDDEIVCCESECYNFNLPSDYCLYNNMKHVDSLNLTHYCSGTTNLLEYNDEYIYCCKDSNLKENLFDEYVSSVESLNCPTFTGNCGTVDIPSLPIIEYGHGNVKTSVPSFDEDCSSICFGNAFLNECQPANVQVINAPGEVSSLSILGKDNFGECIIKYTLDEAPGTDTSIYQGKSMECHVSSGDLNFFEEYEIGCFPGDYPFGCDYVLPGTAFRDILMNLYGANYYNYESEYYDCTGDLVDMTLDKARPYIFSF